jgi:hypothetical protein
MKRFCCLSIVIFIYGCGSLVKGNSFQLASPNLSAIETIRVDCHSSSPTFPLPERKELLVSEPQAIAAVLQSIVAISADWSTWGITTRPAPAKRISLRGATEERMWLGASKDFSSVWNERGYRKLTEAERLRLVRALPEC